MKLLLFISIILIYSSIFVVRVKCDSENNIIDDSAENAIEVTTKKVIEPKLITVKGLPNTTPKAEASTELVCPGKEKTRPFFSFPCKVTKDCSFLGTNRLCCRNRCVEGVPPPIPETKHEPALFGLVDRVCPKDPIPEIFEIKECVTDSECSPRICCPEKMSNGKYVGFCRTAEPVWDRVPVARTFVEPLRAVVSYMQCTPPPPPILDLFPKTCNNPLDCFPNLCCQERGKKFCRPPRRSLLALVADIGQRIVPSEAARKFIERIS